MKITVDGQSYDFETDRLQISEAMEIQQRTAGAPGFPHGMSLKPWQTALNDMNPFAMKALVYLLKQRAGENPDWDTLDFDLGSIDVEDAETPQSPEAV